MFTAKHLKKNVYMKKIFFTLLVLFYSVQCFAADFSASKIGAKITLYYEDEKLTLKTIDYIKDGYNKLNTHFGIDLKTPVTIYVISSKKQYHSRFNISNQDIISGFANLKSNEIHIKAPTMLRYNVYDFEKIIVHELAHIFIETFSYPHTPPRWLHEGVSHGSRASMVLV